MTIYRAVLIGLLIVLAWAAPAWADGVQFNGQCASISWTQNTEVDLAGYKIYDRVSLSDTYTLKMTVGPQVTSVPCSSINFNAGQHYISITSFDTSGNESAHSSEVAFVIVAANTVNDLSITIVNATDMTLSFTEVDGGNGQPATYNMRLATPTISWGSADSVTSGTCANPIAGTTIGATKTCTVTGLSLTTPYQFQLVPYYGTPGSNAVYSPLSNIIGATTGGAPPAGTGRTTLAADLFTRADGNLTTPWVTILSSPWTIVSNAIRPEVAGPAFSANVHTAALPTHQWAEVTISAISGAADVFMGVSLRSSLTEHTSYQFIAEKGSIAGSAIVLRVNNVFIANVATESSTVWAANDVLRAEADNDGTLRLYRNDVLVLTGVDTTLTTGYAGVWGYLNGGAASTMILDTWSAGGFAAAAVVDLCGCDNH